MNDRTTLLDTLSNTNVDILSHNHTTIDNILLDGDPSLNDLTNTLILSASIDLLLLLLLLSLSLFPRQTGKIYFQCLAIVYFVLTVCCMYLQIIR